MGGALSCPRHEMHRLFDLGIILKASFWESKQYNRKVQGQDCRETAEVSTSQWCQKLQQSCEGDNFHDGEENIQTKVLCDDSILRN